MKARTFALILGGAIAGWYFYGDTAPPRPIPAAPVPARAYVTARPLTLPAGKPSSAADDPRADVLDRTASADARREALYHLTQAGSATLPELVRIILAPVPAEPDAEQLEVGLRITALEALDELAARGVEVGDVFARAFEIHVNPALQTLTMVAMSGLEDRRPGRVKRFIDEMTEAK